MRYSNKEERGNCQNDISTLDFFIFSQAKKFLVDNGGEFCNNEFITLCENLIMRICITMIFIIALVTWCIMGMAKQKLAFKPKFKLVQEVLLYIFSYKLMLLLVKTARSNKKSMFFTIFTHMITIHQKQP